MSIDTAAAQFADEIQRAIGELLDRAASRLMAEGIEDLYTAYDTNGSVSLHVGERPEVGDTLSTAACTVSGEFDQEWRLNIVTTWHPPFEHLRR
jgi:hypothetical protein